MLKHETADMYMKGVTYKVNLSCMTEISTASFDAWICLHVLEHVPNDRKALQELLRILKPGGFGILLVPISLTLPTTDEDHVRLYAKKDFMQRIEDAGFLLKSLGKDYFGEDTLKALGLPMTSVLYVVKKPVA